MSELRQAKKFIHDNIVVFHRGPLITGKLTYKEHQTWAYKQLVECRSLTAYTLSCRNQHKSGPN